MSSYVAPIIGCLWYARWAQLYEGNVWVLYEANATAFHAWGSFSASGIQVSKNKIVLLVHS